MHCNYTLSRRVRALVALVATTAASGCSTPEHTNTLIFGTSTRLAIDVSQEPTGSVGATIGYKRHEAVWMPLLANQQSGSSVAPAACASDDCRKFQGQAGPAGGAAGPGGTDTYSVLATFSGDMSGAGQGAQVKTGVAQYFATGIAARLLAQYGGAAAVGAAASAPTSEAIDAAAGAKPKEQRSRASVVATKLSKANGVVDAQTMAALLEKEPAKLISTEEQEEIKSLTRREELEMFLRSTGKQTVDRLFETLEKSEK